MKHFKFVQELINILQQEGNGHIYETTGAYHKSILGSKGRNLLNQVQRNISGLYVDSLFSKIMPANEELSVLLFSIFT